MLGLRPTEGAHGPTELRRLADAQRTRALLESLFELVSGHTVVGHDKLGSLLGNSYMVDLFDCGERLDCIRRRIAPLRQAGYRSAVYATYWIEGDTAHFAFSTFSLTDNAAPKRQEFDLPTA